jgi:hypothetical protein
MELTIWFIEKNPKYNSRLKVKTDKTMKMGSKKNETISLIRINLSISGGKTAFLTGEPSFLSLSQ